MLQNEVRPEIDTDLFVQGILHVDLCEDSKTVLLQCVGCGRNRGIKRQVDDFREMIGHGSSFSC